MTVHESKIKFTFVSFSVGYNAEMCIFLGKIAML